VASDSHARKVRRQTYPQVSRTGTARE